MYSTLSTFNTTTEMPLSKAPNPQLLPGRRSINGCPLLRVWFTVCVCVHGVCVCSLLCVCTLDGLIAEHKFRVWVTILGRISLSLSLKHNTCDWGLTCDETGDDEGQDEHLQHSHEDISRKGNQRESVCVQIRNITQHHAQHGARYNTCESDNYTGYVWPAY